MPPDTVIYHNPRCTKSRQTLELLRSKGVKPTIIEYLKNPPDEKMLDRLVTMLGIEPIDMVRKGEEPYKELGLENKAGDRKAIIKAMVQHPILIERPIVVKGNAARIGRPPERVLEIL